MDIDPSFSSLLVRFMIDIAILSGVPLAIATACGLFVSIFQAVTQIQDQTLSQTIKIGAVITVLLAFGSTLTSPLMQSTVDIFENFATLAQ